MRLIDADTLDVYNDEDLISSLNTEQQNFVVDFIDAAPTVDAEPVVHAHWILEKKYADGYADYKCSNCEFDDSFHSGLPEHFYKRCPHCGAKMDEEV